MFCKSDSNSRTWPVDGKILMNSRAITSLVEIEISFKLKVEELHANMFEPLPFEPRKNYGWSIRKANGIAGPVTITAVVGLFIEVRGSKQ